MKRPSSQKGGAKTNLGEYARTGGPGRPKGSHTKIGRSVALDIIKAYEKKGGVKWLVALDNGRFVSLLSQILPKQHDVDVEVGPTLEDCLLRVARGAVGPEVEAE